MEEVELLKLDKITKIRIAGKPEELGGSTFWVPVLDYSDGKIKLFRFGSAIASQMCYPAMMGSKEFEIEKTLIDNRYPSYSVRCLDPYTPPPPTRWERIRQRIKKARTAIGYRIAGEEYEG